MKRRDGREAGRGESRLYHVALHVTVSMRRDDSLPLQSLLPLPVPIVNGRETVELFGSHDLHRQASRVVVR